jgi:sugar phosphate isomerase/epimerase
MKHPFPFRLGCTSYVYPEDLLPNVQKTAPIFDDIEIILFESVNASNIPSREVMEALAELGKQHEITFTVHFPIDKKAGSADAEERAAYREQVRRAVALSSLLDPYAYLLHLEGVEAGVSEVLWKKWVGRVRETCILVRQCMAGNAKRVCVENLGYPYAWNLPLMREYGFSGCLDVGHVFLSGQNFEEACRDIMPQARVVHLHGWDGRKDHLSLARMDRKVLEPFVNRYLKRFAGVVTLELFSENEVFESVEVLKSLWEK